ncbi:MAG: TonB-dependent receptor [Bacteroidales bacterium]|nr:TonB-dependent receptor [Bacteroidales bacterium]
MRYIHLKYLLTLMVWVCALSLTAQNLDYQDTVQMDEVVVSSNREQTLRHQAPTLVEVLSAKTMQTTNSVCLAQGLSYSTGVRVETGCQTCGFTQARINGLGGQYTQILIDSRPVVSAMGGAYGLEQLPAEMIDRVEIIRGSGSALFGASAVGGTINIITKESMRNTATVSHTLTGIGGISAFDNTTGASVSLVTPNNRAGIHMFGQSRIRNPYDHNNDGFSDIPKLRNLALGFNAYWRPSLHSKLSIQYHTLRDEHRGGNNLGLQPHESNISEGAEHRLHSGQIDYHVHFGKHCLEVYASLQNTNRESYNGGIGWGSAEEIANALNGYGYTHSFSTLDGARYTYSFDKLWFMPATLTAGIEYNLDILHDSVPGYQNYTDQLVHIYSAYLQNEWQNKQWSILIGVRLDKHSLMAKPIVSPRVSVRYSPIRPLSIRIGYGTGFRAPQAYDDDLHVAMVEGERVQGRLADDLREERSHSATVSVDYDLRLGALRLDMEVEGFYTFLNHIFATRRVTDSLGQEWMERYNADKGSVMGAHVEINATWKQWINASVGLTIQSSRYNKPIQWSEEAAPEQRMLRTPNIYGNLMIESNPWRHLILSLNGTLTGPMLVPHEIPTPALTVTQTFFDLSGKIAYDFQIRNKSLTQEGKKETSAVLQLNAGVQNIFNSYQKDLGVGMSRESSYIYGPLLPRSFFVGVRLTL